MEALIYLFGVISLIIISILLTKWIKSIILRIFALIFAFLVMYFSILPEHFFSAFIEPTYCDYHKDEKVVVYTTPEEWESIKGRDIDIKLIVEVYTSYSLSATSPQNYNFNYRKNIYFDGKWYEIISVNIKEPAMALYQYRQDGVLGKDDYIYYDVKKEVVVVGLKTFFVKNKSLLFNSRRIFCKEPSYLTIVNYVNDNYLNK